MCLSGVPECRTCRTGTELFLTLNGLRIDAGFFGGSLGGDLVHLLANVGLIDGNLNGEVDDVARSPVEREARGIMPQHEAKEDWHHESHHAALSWIHARRWRYVLGKKHGEDDEDG